MVARSTIFALFAAAAALAATGNAGVTVARSAFSAAQHGVHATTAG